MIINKVKAPPSDKILELLKNDGLELAGTIPENDTVYEYDLDGKPTVEMPDDNKALKAAFEIFDKIIA